MVINDGDAAGCDAISCAAHGLCWLQPVVLGTGISCCTQCTLHHGPHPHPSPRSIHRVNHYHKRRGGVIVSFSF